MIRAPFAILSCVLYISLVFPQQGWCFGIGDAAKITWGSSSNELQAGFTLEPDNKIAIYFRSTNGRYLNVPAPHQIVSFHADGLVKTEEGRKFGKPPAKVRRTYRSHTGFEGTQPRLVCYLRIDELFEVPVSGKYHLRVEPRIYVAEPKSPYLLPQTLPEMVIELDLKRNIKPAPIKNAGESKAEDQGESLVPIGIGAVAILIVLGLVGLGRGLSQGRKE